MDAKIYILLGIFFSSSWSIDCASLARQHFRSARDVEFPLTTHNTTIFLTTSLPTEVNNTTTTTIQPVTDSSRNDTLNEESSIEKTIINKIITDEVKNVKTTEDSVTDETKISRGTVKYQPKEDEVSTSTAKTKDNEEQDKKTTKQPDEKTTQKIVVQKTTETQTTKEEITEETNKEQTSKGRSLNIDIDKYISPDFHNKNNVYTLPTSPEIEKYLDPDSDQYTADVTKPTSKKFFSPTSHDFHFSLTTPKTDIFDSKFRNVADRIKQTLEDFEDVNHFKEDVENKYELSKLLENVKNADNDTDVTLDAKEYKNLDISSGDKSGNKNEEKGSNVDYKSTYFKTRSYEDKPKDTTTVASTKVTGIQSVDSSNIRRITEAVTTVAPTKKYRQSLSLRNNTIETSAPDDIGKSKHFKLTTTSSTESPKTTDSLDPVYDTERIMITKPTFKRGSSKYTESPESTTKPTSFIDFDNKNFSIPPTATAWTLVTLKDTRSTTEAEQNVQENQLVKVLLLPTTIRTEPENISESSTNSISTKTPDITTETSSELSSTNSVSTEENITSEKLSKSTYLPENISTTTTEELSSTSTEDTTSTENIIKETTVVLSTTELNTDKIYSTTELNTDKIYSTTELNTDKIYSTTELNIDKIYSTTEDIMLSDSTYKDTSNKTEETTENTSDSKVTSSNYDETVNTSTVSEPYSTETSITESTSESTEPLTTDEITEAQRFDSDANTDSSTTKMNESTTENTTKMQDSSTATEDLPQINSKTEENELFTTFSAPKYTEATTTTKKISIETIKPEEITEEDTEENNFGEIDLEYPDLSVKKIMSTVKPPVMNDTTTTTKQTVTSTDTDDITSSTEQLADDDDRDESNTGMIAAIAISSVGGICLIILAGLLLIMRKRQKHVTYGQRCRPVSLDAYSLDNVSVYNSVRRKGALRASKRSYGNPAFDDPVSISNQMNFQSLAKFAENAEEINTEFDEIPQVTARASEVPPGCETKNRYANVIPLPETRVFLIASDTDPHSDYINANYVTGPKNIRGYYIACQAPMQSTVDDFWRMIWEQQSRVILMLTNLYENGVEKCVDYLPPSEVLDCHRLFGDFQITLKKREVKEKYIISNLQLKNMVSNSWREVTHLWYLGWPERGVPSETNSLIAFLIEARSHLKAASNNNSTSNNKTSETTNINISGVSGAEGGPMVVHCSPGTGRTGTVIACDIAIRDFELTRTVDIPKIVYRVRRDRASAVQTREQYGFIYKVITLYATKLTGGVLDSI